MVDCVISDAVADKDEDEGAGGSSRMTYVVTESCIKCKYTDCVDVCPVDCFREGPNLSLIHISEPTRH